MAHLFVIAGHGAGDPGACGHGFAEAERVRALATRVKDIGGDNVTLGDFNMDYYQSNGIASLNIPADWQIVELHMDSGVETARGAHIVTKVGLIRMNLIQHWQITWHLSFREEHLRLSEEMICRM